MTDSISLWKRYQEHLLRYEDLGFSLDISRMRFDDDFLEKMEPACEQAYAHLEKLEAGEKVNTDENRMVGHYWLRDPELAPDPEIWQQIQDDLADAKEFAEEIHKEGKFSQLLIIGIGGSALGPQLVTDALTDHTAPLKTWFFDNTDPDGMDRTLAAIGDKLSETLCVVISKSGGTPETRNGMLEAEAAFKEAGLNFADHAVAITGEDSTLGKKADSEKWRRQFPMQDWVGGRTSVMSTVGLVPHALQGVDLDQFLGGAAAMDKKTRVSDTRQNAAMLLALMWHHAGNGKGEKDMVVLPYKDRLMLFSKYLQQLVMESLGKEKDRDGNIVNQGIAVYGNKGSTDQHAYVQQLRDGVNNFFATFIEVRKGREGESVEVEPGATSGDFLQDFLRGTRSALYQNGRESITLSIPEVNAFTLGMLIALFERAVTFYASLVNINAYNQPGVEAGKQAAKSFLLLTNEVRAHLEANRGREFTAEEIDPKHPEDTYHVLTHLAANSGVTRTPGVSPAEDRFSL